jgi:hypothetical protein
LLRQQRIQEFARDLRQLYIEHGSPTLHELSRRIERTGRRGVARYTLSDWLRGHRKGLPRLEVLVDIVFAITGDRREVEKWRTKWVQAQRP